MTDSTLIAISAGTVWLLGLIAALTFYRLTERNWRWLGWADALVLIGWPISLIYGAVVAVKDLWRKKI